MLLAGASGYIGRAVAGEVHRRGHVLTSLVRPGSPAIIGLRASGDVIEAPVTDPAALAGLPDERPPIDVVVSCLASRTGEPTDAWRIDREANRSLLEIARRAGARRFVLLSAICVQNPRLEFQKAKLAFETELASSGISHAIVRPTAYFKSLAGQIPRLERGSPFVLFGDGPGPASLPISERDLARFIVDCVEVGVEGASGLDGVLPVGGPGPAITPLERGEMLFDMLGRRPRYRRLPLALFDAVAAPLGALGRWSSSLAAKAELARIGRFYATEPMLLKDPLTGRYDAGLTPGYGDDTLEAFYRRVIAEGLDGQELGDQSVFARRGRGPAPRR